MTDPEQCRVLYAGFSYHRKPFRIMDDNGHANYLFRLQTEGRSRTRIAGVLTPVEPGDLMLFPPGDPYTLIIDREQFPLGKPRIESGDYHLFCQGPWIESWWKERQRPQLLNVQFSESILAIFRQLDAEQRRISAYSTDISRHYLQILCMEVDRVLSERPSTESKDRLAMRMKHYVEEHAVYAIQLEDVAAHVDLSVSRAVHLFKEAFGTSIIKYVNEVRLNMAREKITYSPMPLEHIAESCGFANYTYFHRMFRKHYSMSPKQYRTSSREQHLPPDRS